VIERERKREREEGKGRKKEENGKRDLAKIIFF